MKVKPAELLGKRGKAEVLLTGFFVLLLIFCRQSAAQATPGDSSPTEVVHPAADTSEDEAQTPEDSLGQFAGLPVRRIVFDGVDSTRLSPLPTRLQQLVGAPLSRAGVARSLRQVYATGLFETVEADAAHEGDGVVLIFKGTARSFIGTVTVDGARGATLNTQLERASRLIPGTRYSEARLGQAIDLMKQVLTDNGYREPVIAHSLTPEPSEQLVNVSFHVVSGPQARIGTIQLTGDPGISLETFRREAHMMPGQHVDHDTVSRALNGILKHYQKQNRLEAEIKLVSQTYSASTKRIDYVFSANRGPVVHVRVEGANLGGERLKRAIPIYEEGTVDEDLLNEGNRRLRDYFQRLGYFDVKVDHHTQNPAPDEVLIVYTVTTDLRRKVERVSISGNKYFDTPTLKDLLSVHEADTLDRHGLFSQALLAADAETIQTVYRNNGFHDVKVSAQTNLVASQSSGKVSPTQALGKSQGLTVEYQIVEGAQQRVGTLTLKGNDHIATDQLLPSLNTAPGQLFSPQNLADDRNSILTTYLGKGFDQIVVDVEEQTDPANSNLMNVTFHISEGQQVFVRKVLLSGLSTTRPDTLTRAITLKPGDPLSQTALEETQRNLYDFALFNEVDTAVQNPSSGETQKTVLVQVTEARRWTLTYGLGFETQTGTPQNNCAGYRFTGTPCSPNGKTGISPRVLGDVTRNSLFGREESASIQGTYGLLEQKVNLVFQNPHFYGNPNFGMTLSSGYANSQDVTTYVASKLDAGARITEHFSGEKSRLSRANTLIYEYDFRRVKVAASSLQVYPQEIPSLAAAVRVAGPGMTWIRDTRDSPLDAHRGTYTSFQEFFSQHNFGSEAQFNRLDVSNSSFYGFHKNRLVVARNTRYAQERAFGTGTDELLPLPERIYSGGPTSLRGFGVNAAGPRDPETGFPIGGAGALVNSTELRLPPPMLPFFGDSVSVVLFHDMGNVFANAGDAWAAAARLHQPDRDACKVLSPADNSTNPPTAPTPSGSTYSIGQQGQCRFDYFSHAAGLGLRYHTPVGPIRLDFSYNLNPPIYPINVNYSQSNPYLNQHVGEAPHFNFFFSLGQTF